MKVRVVTMRYDETLQGFPEDALKKAQFTGEVLDVREHFFVHGNVPHLSLVMCIGEGSPVRAEGDVGNARVSGHRRTGPDFYLMLPDDRKELFSAIRKWRNETAAGRFPPYVIARNAMIAELAYRVPKTMAALREIDGCGDAFCKKYGTELVALLAGSPLEPMEPPEVFNQAKAAENARAGKKDG